MNRLTKRFDESERISDFINWISEALSGYRGLPMLAGLLLIVFSCIIMGFIVAGLVLADEISMIGLLLLCPIGLLYLGVIVGFIGFMLTTPLGEGYRYRNR